MQVIKIILMVVDLIICLAITVLAVIQSKEDAGLSSTITGSSTSNFFEKNKGRTKEGKQKKWTIILGIAFIIISVILSIIYIA
jgi:preprotein translocase subunit SecG